MTFRIFDNGKHVPQAKIVAWQLAQQAVQLQIPVAAGPPDPGVTLGHAETCHQRQQLSATIGPWPLRRYAIWPSAVHASRCHEKSTFALYSAPAGSLRITG